MLRLVSALFIVPHAVSMACASLCGKADPLHSDRYETEGSEASFDDEDDSEDEELPGTAKRCS